MSVTLFKEKVLAPEKVGDTSVAGERRIVEWLCIAEWAPKMMII